MVAFNGMPNKVTFFKDDAKLAAQEALNKFAEIVKLAKEHEKDLMNHIDRRRELISEFAKLPYLTETLESKLLELQQKQSHQIAELKMYQKYLSENQFDQQVNLLEKLLKISFLKPASEPTFSSSYLQPSPS